MNYGQSVLYDRRVKLAITPFQSPTTLLYGNADSTCVPLRVGFQIERTLEQGADKAKIVVTNMADANRDAIGKDCRVTLSAGYVGRSGLLFDGFVEKVTSTTEGPDVKTEMECSDGRFNIQYATVSRTYSESVTLAQILQDLAADLSLTLDGEIVNIAPGIIKGLPNQVYPRGITLDGAVSFWLDLLLRSQMIDWAVQNGRLLILPKNVPTSIQACVVLSASTGMIETPSFSEKGLKVASLLNCNILPGRLLQVDSKNKKVSGFFKVFDARYEGDTHDQPWRVECDCQQMPGPFTTTPLALPGNFASAVT